MKVPRIRLRVGLFGLAAFLASGCIVVRELPAEPITIENQTQQTLQIWGLDADGGINRFHFKLDFSDSNILREDCEPGFVALREDGSEFARTGQICQGDPPWVITDALEGSN